MAALVMLNGSVTLDESALLQGGGVPEGTEDNNDNDVNVADLPALFISALPGGLQFLGAAKSADNLITVTADGAIVSLGFTTTTGAALPVYGSGQAGAPSGLFALNGGAISLFASNSALGNRVVLGVDETGDIVFALYMEPNAALTSAAIWMAQFEPLANPISTNPDDPLLLGGLGVAAGAALEFDFNALPSGQNLFGTVGTSDSGLVVIGKTVALKADGTFTNASNTINTSQGGGPTTIGVNNQMFDPGDGAYFTLVRDPVANYLSGAPGGLDQNEADDADNIQYGGGTIEVNSSFTTISQTQGNAAATMKITAFNLAGNPQGTDFTSALGSGAQVNIIEVKVNGVVVAADLSGNTAIVSGLKAGDKVEWTTDGVHDQVLLEGVAGKFDIGSFGASEPSSSVVPLNNVRFEDDGPSITGTATGAPTLTVDETQLLATPASGALAAQFTAVSGTDGATSVGYALSTLGGDSGLVDTATGQAVVLSLVEGVVQGRTATGNDLVFTVSVDGAGNVTLDQLRAIVHPTADPDETRTLAAANLVVLTATASDGDSDSASAALAIGQLLVFKDDGPSISGTAVGAPTLTEDESDLLAPPASGAFAAQFTPVYGADGLGATPTGYALSTLGGDSGLVDTATGQAVVLSLVGGVVQGRTATGNDLVFTVSVDGSGNVTLDQLRVIVHPTADPDEARTLAAANLVVLTATANDGDGDSASTALNIGQLLVFRDDGPAIGPIPDGLVDFAAGSTVTKSLFGVVGADPNLVPYTVTQYTPSITTNGVLLTGVLAPDAQSVKYWADTNGDGVIGNTGDTAYYQLTLNESGAGTYTFDALVNPPLANLEFDFNALPSGQNLFGTVGTSDSGLVVIGKTVALKADGTFTNASNTINTSQGGGPTTIGVNNQMFDPGDGAYFTLVRDPVANYLSGAPGGLDQNEADDADNIQYGGGTIEVNSSFTTISQTQGNAAATMKITAFNLAGNPQGTDFTSALGSGAQVNIIEVKVNGVVVTADLSGNTAIVSGLKAGDKVEWTTDGVHDQVLLEGVAGKFDIGGFGALQSQPMPDQRLDFVVQVVDGDGDHDSDAFSVGIDGTGINDDGVVVGIVGVP